MIDEDDSIARDARRLGMLSRKYEVGNRGPGTVSGGLGDPGGISYGSYQLASKLGNPEKFLAAEGRRWRDEFGDARSGTAAFSRTWKAIARREPEAFEEAQHAFIRRTHFEPQLRRIGKLSGVDVSRRSHALRDAVWSTAVQHGPNSILAGNAIARIASRPEDPGFDREAILAIYRERGRTRGDGRLVHFGRSSHAVQRAVAARFRRELADALAMLEAETPGPGSFSSEA